VLNAGLLVASPQLFEAECRTPRHFQLENAFCNFREIAGALNPKTFDSLILADAKVGSWLHQIGTCGHHDLQCSMREE
jgi:hypothetical protein